ncbi:nucleolar protein dao-5-like [Pleurodeles waltl]|uniref:nucleolar protein dao-5-like n=1 Tax=Pleurodeles waltl TaxID=8319 RepID=UPI0037097692
MVKLKEDLAAPDGIHHPPSSFSLGSDSGYLYYPGEGHTARACKEEAPCNLCGAVAHRFKDCPQRAKYYAQAAKPPGRAAQEEAAAASLPVPAPRKTKETGRRKGPGQEQVKPDQGFTPALEPQSTEEEMPAIPESGPTDNAPQPASEIQEEGPWTKQERRKRRHSPPQVTKKTRKKHLSNHNPNSDPEELEEEEQPGNEGPDDQLDQVTRVLQEMRALASVMEAPPPPSPATFEKEEASMEEEVGRNPSPEYHRTKAGPHCQCKGELPPEGIEGRSPEDTRANQEKQPEGTAPQDHKSPGPDPEEEKRKPTVEPTTVTDPATPTETTVSVEPTRPEGTPKNGTPTNAPPLEAQGEPELTPETGAEEGKESMAAARTPTPAPAKSQKKNKHLKKKPDCSSGDEEEIKKAWKQVKSQRLREKCRKEKEERDERRRAQIKGRQSPP